MAEALRADALSERDKLQLLVATLVFANLFGSLGILYAWRMPALLAASLLGLAISLIGLYAAFLANQGGDGIRFVERLVCLGFPVGARVSTAVWRLLASSGNQQRPLGLAQRLVARFLGAMGARLSSCNGLHVAQCPEIRGARGPRGCRLNTVDSDARRRTQA
jgi:hypothetical protein